MWQTSKGNRTLRASEAALVSLSIDTMIDTLVLHLDDYTDDSLAPECQTGITVYDQLSATQRIGLLHEVARYLLTDTRETMPLSATSEAAIAAIFVEIRDQVAIEIDLFSEGSSQDNVNWRGLVLAAYKSLDLLSEDNDDELAVGNEGNRELPLVTSTDLVVWKHLIECLTDAILWDRDFEMAESFLDADPGVSNQRRRLLGIDEDYFTNVAPDPRPEQVMNLVWNTRDIIRSKPR